MDRTGFRGINLAVLYAGSHVRMRMEAAWISSSCGPRQTQQFFLSICSIPGPPLKIRERRTHSERRWADVIGRVDEFFEGGLPFRIFHTTRAQPALATNV